MRSTQMHNQREISSCDSFAKIVSFNILFPPRNLYHKSFDDYNKRYHYQLDVLFNELDEDILWIQEVTSTFIPYLENSEFYSRGYKRTESQLDPTQGHYPMIISRLPFVQLYNINKIVLCLFEHDGINLIVINVHLPYHEGDTVGREERLHLIDDLLNDPNSLTNKSSVITKFEDAVNRK